MEIKKKSFFKDPSSDLAWLKNWISKLELLNERTYESITLNTSLGKTQVWGLNTKDSDAETLVIFPGARTTSLFWDFDKGLNNLNQRLRIFMVETNGLPNLSDGSSPDIKSLDYGHWANEVLNELHIEQVFIAGASFGGLICMKLSIVAPSKIKSAFLLNPGCLQPFSLSFKNLYYNILPIMSPTEKNVRLFSEKAVFCKPHHSLSEESEKLFINYELFALTRYKDVTQKPYYMKNELEKVKVDTYLFEGDKDILFPYEKSISNAKKHIQTLKDVIVFNNVGHGIETYANALQAIGEKIKKHSEMIQTAEKAL